MAERSDILLSILIPVRNEGVNLKVMVKILNAVIEVNHEILIVYDSKEDDSIAVVDSLRSRYPTLRSIHNDLGRGIKFALTKGVQEARGKYVLIFAADEVGPVVAVDDMIMLAQKGCDFVSCTRYAHGGRRLGGSAIGKFLSITANALFHKLMGGVLTDSTTGIKLFKREIFQELNLQAKPVGWAVVFEMAIKAQLLGLKLGEVPIISIDRLYGGKSTFRLRAWVWEYLRWFLWGTVQLRKLPKAKRSSLQVALPSEGRHV